jgi:hypothetical protein
MQAPARATRPSPSVVAAALDDEMVLLNVETGTYFGLDEVGALIWGLVAEELDDTAIVARITSDYDIDELQARSDLHAFIDQLTAKGLLQEVPR